MKKSAAIDEQCVKKIQVYTSEIKEILGIYKISSAEELKNTLAAKYAITQLIVNIYELSRKLQDETLEKLKNFNSPILRKARQISSHDYEAVDFRSIYNLCTRLTGKIIQEELKNCTKARENNGTKN